MYPSSGSTIRADLNIVVEEAAAKDKFHIGARVMPPWPVDAKSGTYPKLDIAGAELMTRGSTLREPGTSYGRVSRKWGTDTYDTKDRGLEEIVDDTDVKDIGRFFDLEATAARLTLGDVKLDHESRVAVAIFNETNFGAATNSNVAYTEANIATINFPLDLLDAIERVNNNGAEANTVVLNSTVLNRLKRSTLLQNFVRGNRPSDSTLNMTASAIQAAFAENGITQVLVGRARENTAKKGQAKSMAQVWNNTYVWVGMVNSGAANPQEGGAGFTLVWNKEGGLWVTETYRNEEIRSNMVRVRQHTAEKVTDATAGTLIATQWS